MGAMGDFTSQSERILLIINSFLESVIKKPYNTTISVGIFCYSGFNSMKL